MPEKANIDWKTIRPGIDLAAVATGLLGAPPGRRGERGRKCWWSCPFHEGDRNPSFCVVPGKEWYHCYGCGAKGDAATLVMHIRGVTFPHAIAWITGRDTTSSTRGATPKPKGKAAAKATEATPATRDGMSAADAAALVADAETRLWSTGGAKALAYLLGPDRCLHSKTIRAARLGYAPKVAAITKDGDPYTASGIVIPWFSAGRLTLVKIRQPAGRKPRYAEVFRDREHFTSIFPDRSAVRVGSPLVIVEGEFDCLVLRQTIGDVAAVITLGSASSSLDDSHLRWLVSAYPWFLAMDGDDAGDKCAQAWPPGSRRVRPPVGKDWTEVTAWIGPGGHGIDLRRWWRDVLAGDPSPPLYTWDELSAWRWGGADAEPGIDVLHSPAICLTNRQAYGYNSEHGIQVRIRADS
jgi:hypothetical protein